MSYYWTRQQGLRREMDKIYIIIADIKHRAQKIRDFSSGDYRAMAVGIIDQLNKLVELLEGKE